MLHHVKCKTLTLTWSKSRSSHQRLKKGVLKNSANFVEKACLGVNFLKKRLEHWCFSAKFAKFLRTIFFLGISANHFEVIRRYSSKKKWFNLVFAKNKNKFKDFREGCAYMEQGDDFDSRMHRLKFKEGNLF